MQPARCFTMILSPSKRTATETSSRDKKKLSIFYTYKEIFTMRTLNRPYTYERHFIGDEKDKFDNLS